MNDWLQLGGLLDRLGLQAPTPAGLLDAPVGTSTTQRVSNASPEFSPMISPGLLSNEQRLGAFWNLATRRAKPWTNRDLPQLAAAGNEAVDAAMNWAGMTTPVVKGIRAFHGSPHTFERFDLSKIGTGEGAQAYGHGLYFAGNEGVAKSYKDAGPASRALYDEVNKRLSALAREIDKNSYGYNNFKDKALGAAQQAEYDALLAKRSNLGSMYEVNLRTSPERLLDWDKPLAQQPAAVREALGAGLGRRPEDLATMERAGVAVNDPFISRQLQDPDTVAQLRQAGIDGIQYLDQGSRAAGDGTRNYVMFRDDIIDILKRYGLLGMIGGGAAATAGAPEQ